jgi:hypothetical protein
MGCGLGVSTGASSAPTPRGAFAHDQITVGWRYIRHRHVFDAVRNRIEFLLSGQDICASCRYELRP